MFWCVLKKYSDYEIRDFIICNGYHGLGIQGVIKRRWPKIMKIQGVESV